MSTRRNRGMIDVGSKKETRRSARAAAFVNLNKEIVKKIKGGDMPKGDVLENARIAGILAAKNTAGLIPLCHNIGLEYAAIDFKFAEDGIFIESSIKATGKTGVEMEAMAASAAAALTIYDMCKMFTKRIEIRDICLIEKRGGRSGTYIRKGRR